MNLRVSGMDGLQRPGGYWKSPSVSIVPKVLMLTTFDVDDYVYEALRLGASGFLLKDAAPGDLIAAVRVVAAGEALLAPTVTRRLIAEFTRTLPANRPEPTRLEALTGREREVLTFIARGLSNSEIARWLVLSEQTVQTSEKLPQTASA